MPASRVVLVSRRDGKWISSCETALKNHGIDAVEAYNCWSAEVAHKLHGGRAIVIDGNLLCDFVSVERPGPILGLRRELPVVIFNAEDLDEQHRSAATAHRARMLDGDDVQQIARSVSAALLRSR